MSLNVWLAYLTAVFFISGTPGPNMLLAMTHGIHHGLAKTVSSMLGLLAGLAVILSVSLGGLGAVLLASSHAFELIKYVGAAYLIYLGVRAFLAKPSDPSLPKTKAVAPARAFLEAIPAEVLNPKTALFFLAFMPQFVHPEHGSAFVQFMVLGLIFVALSSVYTTLLALSIKPLGRLLKRVSGLARWQGKIIGVIFVSLGLKVAAQQR